MLSCKACGKVYKRHDLLVRHEQNAHMGEEEQEVIVPKRGRPKKVLIIPVDDVPERETIFNELKQNMDATFPENGTLKMANEDVPRFESERALRKVLEKILVGLLDNELLKKMGWPKIGVLGALDEVLKAIGVDSTDEKDDEEGPQDALRRKIMKLLGKFMSKEYMESMLNNYSEDQILHYLAESVGN